jgi:hypothetical protein
MPALTQIEEINAHEDIAQTHPHLNIILCQQPADDWEQQGYVCKVRYLLHEMYHDIHAEEREQEPYGRITIKMALRPYMTPLYLVPIFMQFLRKEAENAEIERAAYCAPCQIGNKQTLGLVLQEETRGCRNALIEITCLEEKEADEEEGPCHQFIEPERASPEAAHTDTMQRNHP